MNMIQRAERAIAVYQELPSYASLRAVLTALRQARYVLSSSQMTDVLLGAEAYGLLSQVDEPDLAELRFRILIKNLEEASLEHTMRRLVAMQE